MLLYDFIFSNKIFHRLLRHSVFWIIFLIYLYYTNLFPYKQEELRLVKTYRSAFELMIYFPVSVLSVYISIYFLLPCFILKGKYFELGVAVFCLTIFYFFLAWALTLLLATLTNAGPFNKLSITVTWFQPVRYGIGLPLVSGVMTTIIKLLKIWHQKQKEVEYLQRQKIDTELQLIRTQFQPHFLYGSLGNIYTLLRRKSVESPIALLKLSDILSYILYDATKRKVPLDKEIQVISNYLDLKKIFYPDQLQVHLKFPEETTGMQIEPLVLLAFVENCFENDPFRGGKQITLNLEIRTEHNEVYLVLEHRLGVYTVNGSLGNKNWETLFERIERLYAGRHSFEMNSEKGVTNIALVLEQEGPVVSATRGMNETAFL